MLNSSHHLQMDTLDRLSRTGSRITTVMVTYHHYGNGYIPPLQLPSPAQKNRDLFPCHQFQPLRPNLFLTPSKLGLNCVKADQPIHLLYHCLYIATSPLTTFTLTKPKRYHHKKPMAKQGPVFKLHLTS